MPVCGADKGYSVRREGQQCKVGAVAFEQGFRGEAERGRYIRPFDQGGGAAIPEEQKARTGRDCRTQDTGGIEKGGGVRR